LVHKKTNNPVVIPAQAGMTQKDRVILHELTFVLINISGMAVSTWQSPLLFKKGVR
jgi:hypothetical protein